MKLSLPLIAKRLKFPVETDLSDEASYELHLPRPVFYTGEKVLCGNTLYICKGEDLPARISPEEGCALICVGLPEKTASDRVLTDLLILDSKVDVFKLHNAVNQIYDFYEEWEEDLSQIIQSTETGDVLDRLLQASERVFETPLLLQDPDQKIVAKSKLAAEWTDTNRLAEMAAAGKMTAENIARGGLLLYHLLLIAEKHPLTASDEALLEILSQFCEKFLRIEAGPQNVGNPELSALFISAIEAGHLSKKALDGELKKMSRSAQGRFVLYCMLPDPSCEAPEAGFFCGELLQEIPELFAFLYKETVIAIADETFLSKELIRQHFVHFARENNYRAGESNPFQSLYNIRTYYRQAMMALDIGLLEKPEDWIYPFSGITLEYMFRKAEEEFAPEELYSPIVYRLLEYDKANHTDYLNTLKVYLLNNQNAVQTAKELFIHRGTILYRIKRICEIGQTNLSDPDELLHLYLSLRLMKQQEERKES